MDLPDFVKESVSKIQILCTFQAHAAKGRHTWRETRVLAAALAFALGEKPARSVRMERHAKRRGGGAPLTESDFRFHGASPQNLHN